MVVILNAGTKKKPQTIKIINYFLQRGNKIQLSTKKFVDYKDLVELSKNINYYGQLTIFVSSSTISKWNKLEKGTTQPTERFKSFEVMERLNIPVVLYIKPVLHDITINDVDQYIEIIKKYKISDVVVGSIIKTNGTGEVAPFVNDNSMHTQPIAQEDYIRSRLLKVCNVYTKSIQVLENFK